MSPHKKRKKWLKAVSIMMRWRHREPCEQLARNLYRQYVSLTSRLRYSSLRYTDISDRHQFAATLRRLENVPLMGAEKRLRQMFLQSQERLAIEGTLVAVSAQAAEL